MRSMRAASQLSGKGLADVDDAPAISCYCHQSMADHVFLKLGEKQKT